MPCIPVWAGLLLGAASLLLAACGTGPEPAPPPAPTSAPPPVENGQQLADQVRAQVDDLQADLTEARADLAGADPNIPVAVGPAIAAASNVLASFATPPRPAAQSSRMSGCTPPSTRHRPARSCDDRARACESPRSRGTDRRLGSAAAAGQPAGLRWRRPAGVIVLLTVITAALAVSVAGMLIWDAWHRTAGGARR